MVLNDWVRSAVFIKICGMTSVSAVMAAVECGVDAIGFVFAAVVLTTTVVAFPLLLDRDVGAYEAIHASVRAVLHNPLPMAVWGLIVAALLIVGSLPIFAGLAVALPVLGHATWHVYRKVVVPAPSVQVR